MVSVDVSVKSKVISAKEEAVYFIRILNKAPYTKAQDLVLIGFVPDSYEVKIQGEEQLIPITLSKVSGGTRIQINLSSIAKQTIGVRLTMCIALKPGKKGEPFINRFALKEDGKLIRVADTETVSFINSEALDCKDHKEMVFH